MANLFIEFKKLIKGERPDAEMLVPLLIWASGSEKNIRVCQNINKKFYHGNHKVFISELTLTNTLKHIIRYPKVTKDDEKTKFFYDDVCRYFDWTYEELRKNLSSVNIDDLKPVISNAFGYDATQRKLLKLPKLEIKNAKKRI